MRKKISIFGAGNVGASLAQLIVASGIADCSLIDVAPGLAEGKALDLSHARPLYGRDVKVEGGEDDAKLFSLGDLGLASDLGGEQIMW